MTKVVGGKISEPTTFCYSLEFSHRYMKVHVFVTMVSKSVLKSPNLLPSFTKIAIFLNDDITRRVELGQTKTPSQTLRRRFAVRTGLEPATPGVTGRYSNQLNYRTIVQTFEPMEGIEPTTPRLQITCSGQLSYIGNNVPFSKGLQRYNFFRYVLQFFTKFVTILRR